MSAASRAAFSAAARAGDLARACLYLAAEVDPAVDLPHWIGELDRLAGRVRAHDDLPPTQALRAVLGDFAGDAGAYDRLESSLLDHVLADRSGLPILLSVVWLEVAARAGIPAYGVGLPGHFLVAVDEPATYADPFRGGLPLSAQQVNEMVEAAGAEPDATMFQPWPVPEILLRILVNIREWSLHGFERAGTRLWAADLALLLPERPEALRQERAAALEGVGDFAAAAEELHLLAAEIEEGDEPTAARVRLAARSTLARLN